jgi:diaminopimelate decarboxylase/aspartate kinase
LAAALPDVRIFNLGGGLGVPYGRGRPLDLAGVDAALAEARTRAPRAAEVWLEPGRFLVCEAGVLVLRVTQIKDKHGRRFVGVDGGMNALIRPALYGARHPVVSLTRPGAPSAGRVTLVGPCCESADVLARNIALPEVDEGDLLAVTHAGAYGYTMASRYNRRAVGEVFIPG